VKPFKRELKREQRITAALLVWRNYVFFFIVFFVFACFYLIFVCNCGILKIEINVKINFKVSLKINVESNL